ncbi:MAG TPA: TlpA disulfide reductase family protein [Longimicrobiales bacterium]|nr:TlpA disulfide reductase family protein [Longimicrobiales bacterium]
MKKRRRLVTASLVALVVVLSALIWMNRGQFTPLDIGSQAPEYRARSLDGDTVSLSSFAGEVVVLNVWATWCRPCVVEMPALQRLHDELAGDGLRVVAVSVDAPAGVVGSFGETGGNVKDFVDNLGLTFTVLHDPSGGIESRYQVNGLPTTYVIDRDGRIQRKVMGAREWDEPPLSDQIRQLVEG